jgi:carbonic anhydrase
MTLSALWSSPTSCCSRMSFSSFTTPTAALLFFTDEVMRNLLASSLETAELTPNGFRDIGKGPGSTEGEFIDWLTMKDNAAGVIADVRRIRSHPLIPKSIPIYGYIYDVRRGTLEEVPGAMAAGKAV